MLRRCIGCMLLLIGLADAVWVVRLIPRLIAADAAFGVKALAVTVFVGIAAALLLAGAFTVNILRWENKFPDEIRKGREV